MADLERLDRLEKELSDLKTRLCPKETKEKKEKKPRAESEYNKFVKNFIASEKESKGADYNHKVAFKAAAEAWSNSKKSEK